jgi:formylglycine-generating enzyme required for sulfatase activity
MKLISAAGQSFQMGEVGIAEPVHAVSFTRDFYMDSTEVTQAEYERVTGMNPSNFTGDSANPVEQVTWFDAVLYCNARSKLEGRDTVYAYTAVDLSGNACDALTGISAAMLTKGYRLPTEAEWEYACRAGTSTEYYWGDSIDGNYCWYYGNAGDSTHPVAQKMPNAWGLYDMSGNVWEWCHDWYAGYSATAATDPTGPPTGTGRVVRGGAWNNVNDSYGSAYRGSNDPATAYGNLGFRAVLPW